VPAAGAAKKLQSQHSQQHTKGRMTGLQPSQTFTKQCNGSLSSPKSACQDDEGDVPLNRFKQAARRIVVSLNPNSIELSVAREISNSPNWTGCQRSVQNNAFAPPPLRNLQPTLQHIMWSPYRPHGRSGTVIAGPEGTSRLLVVCSKPPSP
jgi:hypothetical protein